MTVLIIIFFAVVAAIFGAIGYYAGSKSAFTRTYTDVLDVVVVANDRGLSFVRDKGGNFYCLKSEVPVGTRVMITLPPEALREDAQDQPVLYHVYEASENFEECARVIRRVSEDKVLCFRGKGVIFVQCTQGVQQALQQRHNSIAEEKMGHPYVLPIRRLDEEFVFPICQLAS